LIQPSRFCYNSKLEIHTLVYKVMCDFTHSLNLWQEVTFMHEIDNSQWPMLIIKIEGYMTMDDSRAYIGALDEALSREIPFSVVIYTDNSDNKNREAGTARHQTEWLKANKTRIARFCKGLASVTPHASMLALWRTVIRVTAPRMYGCQADMFTSMDEAQTWAKRLVTTD
jgi:hypothetical protein